jgi:sulfite reductase (NADPH) flavoprotein alpha-component
MSTTAPTPASQYSMKNPFQARHVDNYVLTGPASEKETRHHSISLAGSGLTYLPGDALGLVATNCPELADEIVSVTR